MNGRTEVELSGTLQGTPSERLCEKVVLITGSTAGIGRALARGLAAAGAKVWVSGRSQSKGEEVAREIDGHYAMADLASPNGVAQLVETVAAAEPRLDVLVNNAGVELIMPVDTLDMEKIDLMWRVNVRAPIELTTLLLPQLRAASGASVINVTSIHEKVPYAYNSIYCATKAALAMFTKTAAIELAASQIRVNNLAPGVVETEINREVLDEIGRDRFHEWIPLGRVASVEEMIEPAIFLASDASRYMTGATLFIDGGYSEHLVRYRPPVAEERHA